MPNLHAKIMNLRPAKEGNPSAYLLGHADARHAAAELANDYDRLAAVAREALEAMKYFRGTANIRETRELAEALKLLEG